jgi:transcription initiation factor TFIIH subunit 4
MHTLQQPLCSLPCWLSPLQVYAHTSCPLQRRVLARLMRTDCLLPNLFVGSLTRETFLAALELGISAGDVTAFLQQHAHPQVARRVPSVPEVRSAGRRGRGGLHV